MNTSTSTHFCEWMLEHHSHKLNEYSNNRHKKIMDLYLSWMTPDSMNVSFEDLKRTKEFKWIDYFFSKFEFVPLSDWSIEEEQKEIYAKLHYSPFVVSISTEKGHFKFFIIKKESSGGIHKITKHKFRILENGSVEDITGDRRFESYDEMKKYIINNETLDYGNHDDPKITKLTKIVSQLRTTQSKIISDTLIIQHFKNVSNYIKINFTNGSLYFNPYPLILWSNTISTMMDDFPESSSIEFGLQTSREIFIIYILFRISNFFKYKISPDILGTLYKSIPDFPLFDKEFSHSIILTNIIDLYHLSDYLEDRKTMVKLINLFKIGGHTKYEKQNFYDMIFTRQNIS